MPYVEEVCVAGKTIEVSKYYTYQFGKKGQKRNKRAKPSTDSQKKVNQRQAAKKLRRLMNENYEDGDFLLTLDFRKEIRPATSREMYDRYTKPFLRRVRAGCKKAGMELKYILCMEVGKKGGRHIHAVVNRMDVDILRKSWPYGGIHIDPLYSNGQYQKIADYFIKYAVKTEETEGELLGKRWYSSRNLKKPSVKKRIIKSGIFRQNVKQEQGYYVDKESIRYGISDFTGFEFFTYTLMKIDPKRGGPYE